MKKILLTKKGHGMKFGTSLHPEEAGIYPVNLEKGQRVNGEPSSHQVWILAKGKITLSAESRQELTVKEGQVFFLPQGFLCAFLATEETRMICFQMPDISSLLKEVYPEGLTFEKNTNPFVPLRSGTAITEYIRHLRVLLDSCPLSPLFIRMQSYQLLLFFKKFFLEREIAALFSPLLPGMDPFELMVRRNYPNTRSLRELAAACHMGVRTFERQFKKTFGMPPGRWLLERRRERVYREIIQNEEPLMTIADKCGFLSPAQFSDFCRKYLGKAPSELRKGDTR